MSRGPLLTLDEAQALAHALDTGQGHVRCSFDLQRTVTDAQVREDHWEWNGLRFAYPRRCRDRTIYYCTGESFELVSRYSTSLVKLVPTPWGAPTFEIDGIKMLPTAQVSPYDDARRKVGLIKPRGKMILDTCGGLGYFAAWCLREGANRIISFEKNSDVLWLRSLNPWSPETDAAALELTRGDVAEAIASLPAAQFDAVLHDPPRFGIAGELYSQHFYDELARVLKPRGTMFHYTGTPNKLTSNRDVPNEVAGRLQRAGFSTTMQGDGVLAVKKAQRR